MIVHPDVLAQADRIDLDPSRPLILSDADEVILQFASVLEEFLHENQMYLDMATFALTGNIKRRADDVAVSAEEVSALIGQFFVEKTEVQPAVPGAPEALRALSEKAQIIIVTNVPLQQRDARVRTLKKLGMDYPLIANVGLKGAIVKHLADKVEAPVYFIDDIPPNITSVAQACERVHCLHFVADERLGRLLGPAEHSRHRADNWPDAAAWLTGHMAELGY
ncbi:hypothetical protein [Iodidimonas sp. SYSU 1G8]|uniref:hypothetical protein n=1 Tax=Iodidimonas sp. SYSU 1G8 TaxID=3133967 RepID=UPI0031FEFAEE